MGHFYKKTISAIIIVLISYCNSNAQIILNGDFELWPSGCPFNTAPNSWTNYSTSLGPDQAGSCAGTVVSHQGNSHMNLVWYSTNNLYEGASQTITGLTTGLVYKISFYAINNKGLYSFGDPCILDFYLDNSNVLSTPQLNSGGAWTLYSINFTAFSTTQLIKFRVKAGSTGTSGSVGVDAVSISLLSGIEKNDANAQIDVFPNPVNDILNVNIQNNNHLKEIEIFDILGKKVLSQSVNSGVVSIQMEVMNLQSGMYFIHFKDEMNRSIQIKKVQKI